MKDRLFRLIRKSKTYIKLQYMLEISLNLLVYMKNTFGNIEKYCRFSNFD